MGQAAADAAAAAAARAGVQLPLAVALRRPLPTHSTRAATAVALMPWTLLLARLVELPPSDPRCRRVAQWVREQCPVARTLHTLSAALPLPTAAQVGSLPPSVVPLPTQREQTAAKRMERCSDGVEDRGAEEKRWSQ
jgi:hypothetical protein